MMNMIELQEQLKDFSQGQLIQEMKMPSGNVPQYLVLSEMQRRKRMQATAAGDQGMPTTTVAEDAVSAAGVPQGGIAQMARAMAPQTDMTQNTGVAAMAGGGAVQRMQPGGLAGVSRDVGDYAPRQSDDDWFQRWLAGETLTVDDLGPGAYEGAPALDPGDPRNQPPFRGDRAATAPDQDPEMEQLRSDFLDFLSGMGEGVATPAIRAGEMIGEAGGAVAGTLNTGLTNLAALVGDEVAFEDLRDMGERIQEQRDRPSWEPTPGMTTGDMLSPDEQLLPTAEERAAAEIETPEPEAPETPEEAADGAGGAGGSGSASAADRLAQQDRWLSLARFGLGLMSSDQPTFGGAIGEAGMDALDYMQGMEQQRFERDLAERTLAARMAGGAGDAGPEGPTFGLSTETDRFLSRLQMELDRVDAQLAMMGILPGQTEVEAGSPATVLLAQRQRVLEDMANTMNIGSGGAMSALRAFEQQQQGGGNSYDVAD